MAAIMTVTSSIVGTDSTTNEEYSLELSQATSSMTSMDKRAVSVPTAGVTLLSFSDPISGSGSFSALSGIMLVNRDSTNFITIGFVSASDTVYIKLPANRPFFLWNKEIDTNTGGSAFSAFVNITSIKATADTAACKLEYLLIHS